MKKKLLAGLLTISACFALGSTSFAASATETAPSNLLSKTSQVITPNYYSDYFADIEMTVGQSMYVTGYDFWYLNNNDGAVIAYQDGHFEAVAKGYAVIAADYGNNDRLIYRITVK